MRTLFIKYTNKIKTHTPHITHINTSLIELHVWKQVNEEKMKAEIFCFEKNKYAKHVDICFICIVVDSFR